MRFRDIHVDSANRFSLGVDSKTGAHYVSIPVSNSRVDYEEYYAVDQHLVDEYPSNADAVMYVVTKCRNRELDSQLIIQPGSDRGMA